MIPTILKPSPLQTLRGAQRSRAYPPHRRRERFAHDLEDTYLPAFRATVTAAPDRSCAPTTPWTASPPAPSHAACRNICARLALSRDYVVSDCGAATDISEGHHYAKTMEQGIAAAVKVRHGHHLRPCPMPNVTLSGKCRYSPGRTARPSPAMDVDRAVKRLFTARMRLGMFDSPKRCRIRRLPLLKRHRTASPACAKGRTAKRWYC